MCDIISLWRANHHKQSSKSAVGGNLLQSWVNLTIVQSLLFYDFIIVFICINLMELIQNVYFFVYYVVLICSVVACSLDNV